MNIFRYLYTIITFVTMTIGLIVAFMFIIAFLIGGSAGSSLAVLAGEIISWAIASAALAVFFGMIHLYLNKEHSLKIDREDS